MRAPATADRRHETRPSAAPRDCCCAGRNPCYNMRLRESEGRTPGEVDERLKSHAWKACIGSNLSGVRIPLSPPKQKKEPPPGRLFLFGGEKQAACAACAGDSKGRAYRPGPLRIGRLLLLRSSSSAARRGRALYLLIKLFLSKRAKQTALPRGPKRPRRAAQLPRLHPVRPAPDRWKKCSIRCSRPTCRELFCY